MGLGLVHTAVLGHQQLSTTLFQAPSQLPVQSMKAGWGSGNKAITLHTSTVTQSTCSAGVAAWMSLHMTIVSCSYNVCLCFVCAGIVPMQYAPTYCASKHGVVGFSRSMKVLCA